MRSPRTRKRAKRPLSPPPTRGGGAPESKALQYKVVELSTVDESTLESVINQWVALGWQLDGIQFAMRDSSKRPSMAFVLFTQARNVAREPSASVGGVVSLPQTGKSAWDRLRQLAEEESSEGETRSDE